MSIYGLKVRIGEETEQGEVIANKLPHLRTIKTFLPEKFSECKLQECFEGEFAGNVQSCTLTCRENSNRRVYAIIKIRFTDWFRLSSKRREMLNAFFDEQLADGFGEVLDKSPIPGATGYYLYFGLGENE